MASSSIHMHVKVIPKVRIGPFSHNYWYYSIANVWHIMYTFSGVKPTYPKIWKVAIRYVLNYSNGHIQGHQRPPPHTAGKFNTPMLGMVVPTSIRPLFTPSPAMRPCPQPGWPSFSAEKLGFKYLKEESTES